MTHDPGGKSKLKLPEHVRGAALMSDCGRYRPWLRREWFSPGEPPKAILFIGLNPSVADADISDPTCHRELVFAQNWGFNVYLKANLMDYRATSPKDLPPDPNLARSKDNLPTLLSLAAEAETLVLASGNVAPRFEPIQAETIAALKATGKPLMCFGKNKSGSAKHPLYLRGDSTLIPFET